MLRLPRRKTGSPSWSGKSIFFPRGGEPAIKTALPRQFEQALITLALAHTGGRRIEAAQLLGLGRNTLTRKIQELGLEQPHKKAAVKDND